MLKGKAYIRGQNEWKLAPRSTPKEDKWAKVEFSEVKGEKLKVD